MMHTILFYAESFAIQTVILALALWIMILVQKLNCNYPGLIGAAALTVALDMIFEAVLPRFMDDSLADYIARPIVVGVLCFCIAKVTGTTRMYDTDVIFTVAVGGRILTLPPERRSPTRQVLKSAHKRAGSEIGAPQCQPSRGQCQA